MSGVISAFRSCVLSHEDWCGFKYWRCLADRIERGRAEMWEGTAESPNISTSLEGLQGKRQDRSSTSDCSTGHSCRGPDVRGGEVQHCPRCALHHLWFSVDREQVAEGSSSCRERCLAVLPGTGVVMYVSPVSQELWLTFIRREAQTALRLQRRWRLPLYEESHGKEEG